MSIYSKVTGIAPKLASTIRKFPAGRALYLVVMATGVYTVGKKVVQTVKGER